MKNTIWILLYIALGDVAILTMLILPKHEQGISFHFLVSSSASCGFHCTGPILPLCLFLGILPFLLQL